MATGPAYALRMTARRLLRFSATAAAACGIAVAEASAQAVPVRTAGTADTARPVTNLPRVDVTAKAPEHNAKLVGFEDRRRMGAGRFLDRAEIVKWETHRTEDMLQTLPGVTIFRNNTVKAFAASGRAVSSGKCAFCKNTRQDVLDPLDYNQGAPLACYMDVYVDGVMVYNSTSRGVALFDVNSIPPAQIDAVEIYMSASQTPAAYNKTSGGCGVMLVWTRVK